VRVLIACEFSGIVRDAFTAVGHEAVSVDLEYSEKPGKHVVGDVRKLLGDGWDIMVAFPPCTALCNSGNRWYANTVDRDEALDFVWELMHSPIKRWAIENPVGAINTEIRPPDQIIYPWQYGHGVKKTTCLWLQGLPKLRPTNMVKGRVPEVHWAAPGYWRWKERSRTYEGIARAMANQWGNGNLPVLEIPRPGERVEW